MWRFVLIIFVVSSCTLPNNKKTEADKSKLFVRLSPEETGVDFQNTLEVKEDFDVFRYRNFYNGGGVAIADINNDSLPDIYLTSNMGDNKLYLNKGNWKFEDVTEKAGVKGSKYWSTGVSIADVNSDGLLDIYVSNAGDIQGDNRENELFINNGDLTFTEKAAEYGLNDKGFSTHATFFDFDKDGDLDCYVLNNSYRPVASLGYRNLRNVRDEFGGHKLYRNDDGKFHDISEQAGIYGSVIGFGLGVTVGDVNQDNWLDLYISNDFYERDYLYINNHDGTFREELEKYMGHISMFSMGADLADLTNDGYPEIFSTDMLPEDDYRLKTISAFEPYDVYQLRLKNGYYHQFMRNMLHLNNQDGTFSEVGQMAGVDASDWSWGALIADFNNDLNKEIFVCNGIYKDVTTQDFVEFLGSSEQMRAAIEGKKTDFKDFVDRMPSVKLSNHMFARKEELKFEDISAKWGLDEPSFSNGAAYGDLDGDGDLDLVVNNVNQDVFVYKNQSRELENNNFIAVTFKGYKKNQFGLGANVKVYVDDQIIAIDNMPIRGFQSSMDYKMIFGLGKNSLADSLEVMWPDDKVQIIRSVTANQTIALDYANAVLPSTKKTVPKTKQVLNELSLNAITHIENNFNDFDRDRLLYHMLSTQGPGIAVADLNNDGFDDFYLGGSVGNPGKLYMQRSDRFDEIASEAFTQALAADEVDAVFFDMDNDGDKDLYVVTGGSENLGQSVALRDKLYENTGMRNGVPVFKLTQKKIPDVYQSGSCVRPTDVDNDGDIDLFIGTRGIPSYYGLPADQFLLINEGSGVFKEASPLQVPSFRKLGIVTDAQWFDYDKDGFQDLVVVGEWMPVTIFSNDGKQLKKMENIKGLENSQGLWNTIEVSDLDLDGDPDFVIGNLGLNSKLQASIEAPLILHVNDFDQNGSLEPVFTYLKNGKEYPMALRQDIIKQMSSLKKKFVYYKDYADKSIADIFDAKLIADGETLRVVESRTSIVINESPGFVLKALPTEAQVAPVYGIVVHDINGDKKPDIVLGGNLFSVKPEIGRYDALHGLALEGDGRGNFSAMSSQQSGLKIEGEVRHIATIKRKGSEILSFIRNNDTVKFYIVNK